VELRPTKSEARAIVVSVQVFWAVAGIGTAALVDSVLLAPVFLLGMGCGFGFYVLVYRVAGRELGRPAKSFWFPWATQRQYRQPFGQRALESYSVLFKLMNPFWWHRTVAPATGWPVALVDIVMVLGLLGALVAGPLLGWPTSA